MKVSLQRRDCTLFAVWYIPWTGVGRLLLTSFDSVSCFQADTWPGSISAHLMIARAVLVFHVVYPQHERPWIVGGKYQSRCHLPNRIQYLDLIGYFEWVMKCPVASTSYDFYCSSCVYIFHFLAQLPRLPARAHRPPHGRCWGCWWSRTLRAASAEKQALLTARRESGWETDRRDWETETEAET